MAHWLRVLSALIEGLVSVPSAHIVAHNCLSITLVPGGSDTLVWPVDIPTCRYMHK